MIRLLRYGNGRARLKTIRPPFSLLFHSPISVDRNICRSFPARGTAACFRAEINWLSNPVGLFGYDGSDRILPDSTTPSFPTERLGSKWEKDNNSLCCRCVGTNTSFQRPDNCCIILPTRCIKRSNCSPVGGWSSQKSNVSRGACLSVNSPGKLGWKLFMDRRETFSQE